MILRNITANVAGRVWSVVSVYLFIPVYLTFLGPEAYGLIGFYTTLLGVLAFTDLGLTATLNREMARLSVRQDSRGDQCDLLRTLESVYVYISLALAIFIWLLAAPIAGQWLQLENLNRREVVTAIRLMAVSIALQLPANLYIGGLLGLQKQVLTNSLQIGWSALRGIGAILVLWLISPTILAFAYWQLLSNIVYCLTARTALWRTISLGETRPQFRWAVLSNTWRYAAGMVGMTLLSTLVTQTDKLAVSKMLPLETFGYYMVAVSLSQAPRTLASPIAVAVFPRLTGLVATGNQCLLSGLYHRAASLVAVATIPTSLTLAFFASDVIRAWTGSITAAEQVGMTAALLLGGELMQAITAVPCYLALAHGNVRINLQVGVASVLLLVPLLIVLLTDYGVLGAGISWFVMNLCTLPPYMYFLHLRFLPGEFRRWCWSGAVWPLLIAMPCVLVGRWLVPHTDSRISTIASVAVVWCVATVGTALTSSQLRQELRLRLLKRLGTLSSLS